MSTQPIRNEAIIIGDYPLKADQAENYKMKFAPAMSLRDAFRYVSGEDEHQVTNWIQATYRRSNRFMRLIFFVMIDGWYMLSGSLVKSYGIG